MPEDAEVQELTADQPADKAESPEKIKSGDSLVTEVSKKVSWILRHGMHTLNDEPVDEDGYIRVDALWKTPGLQHLELATLLSQIYASNEQKRRYDLKDVDGDTWIRATKEKTKKEPKERKEPRDREKERDRDGRRAEDDRPPKGRGKQTHRPPPDRSSWGQKPKDVSQIGKQWVVANNVDEVIVREGTSTTSLHKYTIHPGQLVTQVGADEEIQGTGIIRMEVSFSLNDESCSGWVTKTAEAMKGPRYFYPPRQDRTREIAITSISTHTNCRNNKWERSDEKEGRTGFPSPNSAAAPLHSANPKPFNENAVPFHPRSDPPPPPWIQQPMYTPDDTPNFPVAEKQWKGKGYDDEVSKGCKGNGPQQLR